MKKRNLKAKKSFILPFYIVLIILALGVFSTVFQTSQRQNFESKALTNCDVSAADLTQSANEKAMFDQINAYRQQNGVAVLTWSDALKRPAKWLSNDATARNSSSQTDSLGRDTLVRSANCGAALPQNWGELMGIGPIDQAMTALKNNSKDTLLNAAVMQMAVGQTGNYWAIEMADVVDTGSTTTPTLPSDSSQVGSTAAPTFTSIGDCTANQNCPTGLAQPTSADVATVDPAQGNPTAVNPTPCPISSNSYNGQNSQFSANWGGWGGRGGGWWRRGGGHQGGLLQFLLQLLGMLLQLLGGGKVSAPGASPCAPIPSPTDVPAEVVAPSSVQSPVTSEVPVAPSTGAAPTTAASTALCGQKSTPPSSASTVACSGLTATQPTGDGFYEPTNFGCNTGFPKDSGDNCIPACDSIPECSGTSGAACEEAVQWYSANADQYGCNAKLKVTNPTTGEAVIVRAIDKGPGCSVQGSGAKFDMSQAAYAQINAGSIVNVEAVDDSTPLGPIAACQ